MKCFSYPVSGVSLIVPEVHEVLFMGYVFRRVLVNDGRPRCKKGQNLEH